jgi:hypothetical protein
VNLFNRYYPQKNDAVITRRVTEGRAFHSHQCPVCGQLSDHNPTRQGEKLMTHLDIPLESLSAALPGTAEWQFVNQWWLRMPTDEHLLKAAPRQMPLQLDF